MSDKGQQYKKISDEEAKKFWETTLANEFGDEAPWANFYAAFEKQFPMPDFATKDQIGKKCLEAILSETPEHKGSVLSIHFGEICEWFGPLKGDKPMIGRMMDVMAQSWFFGDLSAAESGKELGKVGESGRFLVRLGHKIPGSFVVTHLKQGKKEKEMAHIQIEYTNGVYSCKKEKIKDVVKLSKLIKQLMQKYPTDINKPCPNAPYTRLFPYWDGGDDSD